MVAWHRALAHPTRHSKALIHLSCRCTESFRILRCLSYQVRLSVVGHVAHGLTTWACNVVRCWGFEDWLSHASLSVYIQLSVQAIRCCSHLAWPCEVFHNWGGKTSGTLIDRSHDARPESRESTGIEKCVWSQDIWPESYLPTTVGHVTRVRHTTRVMRFLHYNHV
jgi:hypothetical protein